MPSEATLFDDQHEIIFKNSNLGKEEVYFNGNLVSDKRVLKGSSSHSWANGHDKYELVIKIGLYDGKIELLKNDQQVDFIEGRSIDVISGKRTCPPKGSLWVYALNFLGTIVFVVILQSIISGKKPIFYFEDTSKLMDFISNPIGLGVMVFCIVFICASIYAMYKSKYF